MPEFEETENAPNPTHSYTPSKEAEKKPRTRRRSGGFKTDLASASAANIGEVDPADALKEEKLSGTGKSTTAEPKKSTRSPKASQGSDTPKSEFGSTNQPVTTNKPKKGPSPETRAAIERVEADIAKRKAERDAKRAEREKNRPKKSQAERSKDKKGTAQKPKPTAKKKDDGLLAKISAFFGQLFGKTPEPPKKSSGRSGNRGGRPQGKSGGQGNRNSQNRRGGQGGNRRGGQNRRRGKGGGNKRQPEASRSES
ncbi:MAG: hypothetical protein AAF546_14795 [Verrucomicrobiota bacterium]